MSAIESLNDLRPGDIMFGPIGGVIPGLLPVAAGQAMLGELFRVGGLSVRHVGIVVAPATGGNRPRLVQAMPGGAEEIAIHPETHWTPRHAYCRLPEDYPEQAQDASDAARGMLGTPYSWLSYAALAAWKFGLDTPRLEAWITRRSEQGYPVEAICSVLADQAWSLAGKRVMVGVPHQCVTPGALAARLLRTTGAEWAWPG